MLIYLFVHYATLSQTYHAAVTIVLVYVMQVLELLHLRIISQIYPSFIMAVLMTLVRKKEFQLVVLYYLTDVMQLPDFSVVSVVNCSDFVASSSSSLMEPSHASSKLKEKIIF